MAMSVDNGPNRHAGKAAALYAIAAAVGRSLDPEEVIREAISQTLHVTDADTCGVYLREPRSGDLLLEAVEGASKGFSDNPHIRRVPAGVGWWGEMVRDGRPVILEDIGSLERPSLTAVLQEGLQSAAYVPLRTQEHINGAIIIASRHTRRFDASDVELLSAIGELIGVAVENARLFDAEQIRVRQLALINEVSRRVTATLDLDDLLTQVVTVLHESFGYEHAAILLRDPTGNELELKAIIGSFWTRAPGEYRQSVSKGMIGRCARTGDIALANDVTQDRDYFYMDGSEPCASELCVPIKTAHQVVGVLDVQSTLINAFDENDIMVIQTLADQLSIAVQNARLFQKQAQQVMKLRTLDEVARTISGRLDLDQALDRILTALERVVAYASAAVWLVEGDQLQAVAARRHGEAAPAMEVTLPTDDLLFQEAQRSGQPVVLQDAQADPRFRAIGDTGYVRGWVLAPLIVRDRVIGCLTVDSEGVAAYTAEDAQTIMTFARHAAIVLDNARLYAQTKHQVETLQALHSIAVDLLSRRKRESVLQDVVLQASRLTGASGAGIFLRDPATGQLKLATAVGPAEEYVGHIHLAPGEGLAGRVVQEGEPMWVDDYQTWQDRPQEYAAAPFRAALAVPLKYEGRILGALFTLQDSPGQTFGDTHAQLLTLLASQAAVALENARLYEELKKLATHDGLTGLYNHRHFHELLEQEVERADRYAHALALMIIDLDGFKAYNDRHGHVAGDEALRGVATLLRRSCRQGDHIARYGGEEFAIILPETPLLRAAEVAERIRQTIGQQTRKAPFLSPLTASIGVAGYPDDAGSPAELLLAADGMMYQAKSRGKNQVASTSGAQHHSDLVDSIVEE